MVSAQNALIKIGNAKLWKPVFVLHDDVLVAEESSLAHAIAEVLRTHHFAIEGSAAVVVAALLDGLVDPGLRRVGLLLTGGNIDYARLRKIIQEESLTDETG